MKQNSLMYRLGTVSLAALASALASAGFWYAANFTTCQTDTCPVDRDYSLIAIGVALLLMLIMFSVVSLFQSTRAIDIAAWIGAGAIVLFLAIAFFKSGMSVSRAVDDFRTLLLGPVPMLLGIAVQRRIFRMRNSPA